MQSATERFGARLGCVIVAPEAVKIEAVSDVSILRKLGAAARVANEHAGRNRTLSAIMRGVSTTARSFGHALHQLWLEVTGTIFLAMAAFGGVASVREYMNYTAGRATRGRLAIAICFALTFGWFGLSSFWRTRKKRS